MRRIASIGIVYNCSKARQAASIRSSFKVLLQHAVQIHDQCLSKAYINYSDKYFWSGDWLYWSIKSQVLSTFSLISSQRYVTLAYHMYSFLQKNCYQLIDGTWACLSQMKHSNISIKSIHIISFKSNRLLILTVVLSERRKRKKGR